MHYLKLEKLWVTNKRLDFFKGICYDFEWEVVDMLKNKEELTKRITKICESKVSELKYKEIIKGWTDKIFSAFNVPYSISNDIVTLRVNPIDYDDFVLFAVLATISDENIVKEYYTEAEIKKYSNQKYKDKKIKFPIKWKMIQVSDDQWIGSITVKELMQLRDARLINYNENTQRPLSRKTINGEEVYRITINESAIAAIKDSYTNGTYISNTITLNVPEDAEMYYSDGEVVINQIESFDILDGYHRYLAMQRLFLENKSFDYTMEFRLVCFPEEKAKQFIWQEDQKTKMSKLDSDSMNQNNIANQIVNRLNQKSPFNGLINNNKSIIDAGSFSYFINQYLCGDISKKQERKEMIAISNRVYDSLLLLVDNSPSLIDKRWDLLYLVSAIHAISLQVPNNEYVKTVDKLYKIFTDPENEIIVRNFRNKNMGKIDINRINNLYNGKR